MKTKYRRGKRRNAKAERDNRELLSLLEKYPQGLTSREIMNYFGISSPSTLRNRITRLREMGKVVSLGGDIRHSHKHVTKADAPYETPTDRHLKRVDYNKSLPSEDYMAPRALRVLEQYPEGLTMRELMSKMNLGADAQSSVDWALLRFEGSLVEVLDADEHPLRMDRTFRVKGSESDECIEHYNRPHRNLVSIYMEHERKEIQLNNGKMTPIEWSELELLIRDVDENKTHTPKDTNMKIKFKNDVGEDFTLILTNKNFKIFQNREYTEYTLDEIIPILKKYSDSILIQR